MRIESARFLAVAGAMMVSACANSPSNDRKPMSFPVACRADQNVADCLRVVSEFCGSQSYDLYDSTGKTVTLAELKYDKATARCRTAIAQ